MSRSERGRSAPYSTPVYIILTLYFAYRSGNTVWNQETLRTARDDRVSRHTRLVGIFLWLTLHRQDIILSM